MDGNQTFLGLASGLDRYFADAILFEHPHELMVVRILNRRSGDENALFLSLVPFGGIGQEQYRGTQFRKQSFVGIEDLHFDFNNAPRAIAHRDDLAEFGFVAMVGHGIDNHLGRLAFPELTKVIFLDIGIDFEFIEFGQRNDGTTAGTGTHAAGHDRLALLGVFGDDRAIERRIDEHVTDCFLGFEDAAVGRGQRSLTGFESCLRYLVGCLGLFSGFQRTGIACQELLLAFPIAFALFQVEFGFGNLRFGQFDGHFLGSEHRVEIGMFEFRENSPRFDFVSLFHGDILDTTGNFGSHGGLPTRFKITGGGEMRRDLAFGHDAGRLDLDHRQGKESIAQCPIRAAAKSPYQDQSQHEPQQAASERGLARFGAVDLERGKLTAKVKFFIAGRGGRRTVNGGHKGRFARGRCL